jgi:hypothetical protein
MRNKFSIKPPLLVQQPLSMEASLSPLSSRAQPRDLQFHGPFLEMFFLNLDWMGGVPKRLLRRNKFNWNLSHERS